MKYWLNICLLCLLVFVAKQERCNAQTKSFYNYNIYNGLPSNFVYQAIVDTNGYLWLATTKGVVKYNGYSFKRFGIEDGLGNEDVWQLVEDDYNRIWLGSISSTFGYIKNDKYVAVKNDSSIKTMPRLLQRIKGGVCFLEAPRPQNSTVGTITANYFIDGKQVSAVKLLLDKYNTYNYSFGYDGSLRMIKNMSVFNIISADRKLINKKVATLSAPYSFEDSAVRKSNSNADYFISYHRDNDVYYFIHPETGVLKKYKINLMPYEKSLTVAGYRGEQRITTNKRITVLNDKLEQIRQYYLKDLIPVSDTVSASLVWYLNNKLWNGFTTTSNMGVYQHFDAVGFSKYSLPHMEDAVYVGVGAKGSQFWWNNTTHELVLLEPGGNVHRRVYNEFLRISSVNAFIGRTIVMSGYGNYIYDEDRHHSKLYFEGVKCYFSPEWSKSFYTSKPSLFKLMHSTSKDVIFETIDTGYLVSHSLVIQKHYIKNDTLYVDSLMPAIGSIYALDTVTKWVVSNMYGGIGLCNIFTNKQQVLSVSALRQLGIDRINGIKVDQRNGSVFFLCKDMLLMYDATKRRLRRLKCNFNLTSCSMELADSNLVLASHFGLVMYKVYPDGNILGPHYKINYKYKEYKFLYGDRFHVGSKVVTINTDKGLLYADIPVDSVFCNNTNAFSYRLLVKYGDTSCRLRNNDTIKLEPNKMVVLFDIINPSGVGQPKYYYNSALRTDSWNVLNGSEWFVSGLLPGTYNKVYLKVVDEGWSSSPIIVWVYVKPYWWQTTYGKMIIGFAILVLVGGVTLLATYITRRQVNKLNAQKNLQAELKSLRTSMELKSIHAQINPHFIFNTLSTGLYYIKKNQMEDAYDHISAFSELLRNYIKSSRDKYITLNEEIDNLKRYVTLQQSRFENLHEFDVEVGEDINVFTEKIPALLLQPLVENAINHGLFHKLTQGRLLLRFDKNISGDLVCRIEDDGVGREKSKAINAETRHKTQSYGTDLVKELIETFNKYEPIHITIEYIDKVLPETGTIVILTIKQLQNDKHEV